MYNSIFKFYKIISKLILKIFKFKLKSLRTNLLTFIYLNFLTKIITTYNTYREDFNTKNDYLTNTLKIQCSLKTSLIYLHRRTPVAKFYYFWQRIKLIKANIGTK